MVRRFSGVISENRTWWEFAQPPRWFGRFWSNRAELFLGDPFLYLPHRYPHIADPQHVANAPDSPRDDPRRNWRLGCRADKISDRVLHTGVRKILDVRAGEHYL